jgi:hypothetical protein
MLYRPPQKPALRSPLTPKGWVWLAALTACIAFWAGLAALVWTFVS